MPVIIIKDYTWRDTADFVIIYVPFKSRPKKIDFLVIDNYLKASCPPFLLELFLWANIIEERSTCTLDNDKVIFSLRKANVSLKWPQLELNNLDKNTKKNYRDCAIERIQKVTEERQKTQSEKRQYLKKEAVRAQIDLDTAVLNKINAVRDSHRKEAMKALEDWRSKAEIPILKNEQGKIEENRKAYKPPLKWFKDDVTGTVNNRPMTDEEVFVNDMKGCSKGRNDRELDWNESKVKEASRAFHESEFPRKEEDGSIELNARENDLTTNKHKLNVTEEINISTDSESDSDRNSYDNSINGNILRKSSSTSSFSTSTKSIRSRRKELIERILTSGKPQRMNQIFDEPNKAVPLPRKNATINIKFSERTFPTPARESHLIEEREWLEKQAEARRKTGFVAEDLRPEERDPQWLKDKGDEFFKAGNYLGAISAYSLGIKISDKMASLYVNKSAAHYALGNYYRCTEDCSKALELMEPKCESNRESRARCHARRGAALCKLSAPQHGIPELEAAVKLAPNNESIKRDLLIARQYFNIKD
ncbi:dynein axonemal assembly factor 4-like [Polistes fuscatus]|uniref:dynein axonemal assembly factor 4-like n=1 Tax=Polistes fuscatus TaxID=30207 RepID=UPI001CAA40BC|nr:dynein axonemal assembly factor 4-like [Polistes fuscatus]